MQILVKGLWCTETAGIDCTERKIPEGAVADIYTRREDRFADKIVLIHTHPGEQTPVSILPFVLKICTDNVNGLLRLVIVAQRNVVQSVIIVFYTCGELRRHKEESIEFD